MKKTVTGNAFSVTIRQEAKMAEYDFYPYGVSYYRPPTPVRKHWDKDLANIASCGMNTVRLSAFWSRVEKTENNYDFAEFDAMCEAAAAHGLKILMTLYVVNMPEWMFERWSDSRMVSAAGRVQYSEHHPDAVSGGWPGLCMDNPKVMERVKLFIKAITLHYKGDNNILAFDVIHEPWEEPSQEYYIDTWKNAVYCYCTHSIEKFKCWLQKKYETLDILNDAWSRNYSAWSQVQPPRNFGAYADWLDWRTFSTHAVAEECMEAGQEIHKHDPNRIIVNHTGGVLNAFATSADAYLLAKTVNIPGMSNYSFRSPQDAGMSCDMVRTAKGGDGIFWVGETSGGSGPMFSFIGDDMDHFFAFGKPWTKESQRKHIWKMLAHGAKGIMYWMWRPEIYGCETAAMGFTDRAGNLTERTANAKNISDVIFKNKDFFLKARTETSETAILYTLKTSILEGYVSTAKSLPGYAGLFAKYKDLASLSGAAKISMENCLPVDYVNDTLVENGALENYKLLIMPFSICMNGKTAEKIREFVRNGGVILADALCGYFTEKGWGSEIVPAYGLDEIFGLSVPQYDYAAEQILHLGDVFSGNVMKASFIKELLVVTTGEIAGRFPDGAPAVVVNNFGKGKTIYIASCAFLGCKDGENVEMHHILQRAIEFAGVSRRVHVENISSAQYVEGRILTALSEELLIVMNHSEQTSRAVIHLCCEKQPAHVENAESGQMVPFSAGKGNIALETCLAPFGVSIYKLLYI
jgi:beta-galactosidase